MANVVLEKIGKHYGPVEVLKGISIEVEEGEFVALVGPSGCGKSTLLRTIAGLEDISAGVINIGGRVVNDLRPMDRDIAMVFQNYALYPQMSVLQNMSFSLKLKGVPKAQVLERVNRAAAILGLENLLQRYPRQLSGGQRQRVAMGRAIVRDPQVFLFDEPLSNLDAKLRVQMRAEIKELHQRLGTTMIYVTHDQVEAMTMASKIVVLRDGVVEQIGGPLELYDNPRNKFVAGFIGSPSMNLLDGKMTPEGFTTPDGIVLPTGNKNPNAVTYGVRPEHLTIAPTGMPLKVSVVEPTGFETQIIGTVGNQHFTGIFRDRIDAAPGSTIHVSSELSVVHLFDEKGDSLA
ncbi:sn-glycerol-3-phosphate ABC transporter ATP-binding protein UgpC [Devosia rhodophyticola]|uniref:Sn-glycerol-3-phosphate ABC transporter ATP-binding protein UgpC n=1 Tax=Devosia rhodophyticola TaxID=3026423 RepID=A0ABY7Z1P7_9HYPH|nr:sn-glycerol-3-phosphate ABC transporter ATP-binding protein UgpC [Devosia rhodophyticola]WDR07551.1 sn-glycerol-3-phosphate ABC transporter ATP-binding protein UgpC [Devosia rhodophyticola]